jgi:hypothetical protein
MKYSGTIRFVGALGAAIAISTSVALRAEDPKETPIQGTIRLSNTQDREIALVESAKISIQQAITAALSRDREKNEEHENGEQNDWAILPLFSTVQGLDEVGETFPANLDSDTEQNERREPEKDDGTGLSEGSRKVPAKR